MQTQQEHRVVVFGPVAEGDKTISGKRFPMAGYAWTCTCRSAGFGYIDEAEAERFADAHCGGE